MLLSVVMALVLFRLALVRTVGLVGVFRFDRRERAGHFSLERVLQWSCAGKNLRWKEKDKHTSQSILCCHGTKWYDEERERVCTYWVSACILQCLQLQELLF